ncbi:MAG TPA: hypothetical protein VK622_13265, partial [Puia sp.]|nr:hypothetical protein [Puia sp.]
SQQIIYLGQFQTTELGHRTVYIERESKVVLTGNKQYIQFFKIFPVQINTQLLEIFLPLMQGIRRLYEDG